MQIKMAAHVFRATFLRNFPYLPRLQTAKWQQIRFSSSESQEEIMNSRRNWVVLTDNGQTIVCWHPDQQFPYECSKPLPVMDPRLQEGDSPLKLQYRIDDLERLKPDGLSIAELQALTFTNKHIWFPRKQKRYRNPNPPQDRAGL